MTVSKDSTNTLRTLSFYYKVWKPIYCITQKTCFKEIAVFLKRMETCKIIAVYNISVNTALP